MTRAPVTLLLLAVVASPLCAEVWMKVTSHTHTLYSDGGNSILEVGRRARATGSRFCVITDHVEAIEKREKGGLNFWQPKKLFGFENWAADLNAAARELRQEGLEIVPGGEGALDTRPEGLMGANHMLMIGGKVQTYDLMRRIVIQSGDPDLMASRLRELADASGAVLIAAHPNCTDYKFDKSLLRWVDGIEVFDGVADPMSELRTVISHPEARSRPITVVTGSDFHADGVSRLDTLARLLQRKLLDAKRSSDPMTRHTWIPVSSSSATREELTMAIRQRRAFAAIAPARFKEISTLPGGTADTREPFVAKCIGVNPVLGLYARILLVCKSDGRPIEYDVPLRTEGDLKTLSFDFSKVPPVVLREGSFLYLMVANQIATSGIELAPRPDIVVAKKRNLLQQASDLLGQVAEVLTPTASAAPQEEPVSQTPSLLDISGTWAGSGAFPDGSWPCQIVSAVTRNRDGTFLFMTKYTWTSGGGQATVKVSRRLFDTGVVQDVTPWAVFGTSPSGQSPYKTGGVLRLTSDGVLVFSHPAEPLVTQFRLCRQ